MEGTRHEKAIVVIASYVIGFVTAFILFGSQLPVKETNVVYLPQANTASVVEATLPEVNEAVVEEAIELGTSVEYVSGELKISVNGEENLLSFNPALNNGDFEVDGMLQGYHYGDLTYKVSQDKSFVFFCEVHEVSNENCHGFIYDVGADRIYPIIKDGSPVFISPKSAVQAIWTAVGIKIGSNYSANPSAPWVLIDADSKLDLQ